MDGLSILIRLQNIFSSIPDYKSEVIWVVLIFFYDNIYRIQLLRYSYIKLVSELLTLAFTIIQALQIVFIQNYVIEDLNEPLYQ